MASPGARHSTRHDPRHDPLAELVARLDPTNLDLTDLDLDRFLRSLPSSPGALVARLTDLAREATYVTVGLGVLNVQRAQVRRRDLGGAGRCR